MIKEYIHYLHEVRGMADNTTLAYARDLYDFVAWARTHVTDARWSKISRDDVERYVSHLHRVHMSVATIRRRIVAIRRAYQWAVYHGKLSHNPAQYVSSPRLPERLPNTLPLEDVRAAIDDPTTDKRTRAIISLIAETGLRIGEVMDIDWEDVDVDSQTIRVTGKGGRQRVVRYGARTQANLVEAWPEHTGRIIGRSNERGTREKVWQALRKHTDAKKCSAHIIRHTFATAHVNAGTDMKCLADMMGHKDIHTTEIYAHVAGARLLQSFNNIKI